MVNNKLTLLTAAAAMAQQVSGLSAHRHLHAMEKRALDAEKRVAELEARGVVVQTEWVYVTTTVQWSPDPTDAAVVEVQSAAAAAPTTLAKVVQAAASAPAVSQPAAQPAATKEETQASKPQTADKSSNSNTATSSTSGSFLSSKRGIAYNSGSLANSLGGACESCSWGYNWESSRNDFDSKYQYVPMLWGPEPKHSDQWSQNANNAISSGSKALFSFNEPDISSQANLSPSAAAQAHQQFMNPFKGKALIGAPAVSNSGNANEGLDWLQQFVNICNGACEWDFCNVHWYSQAQYADTLFTHLEKAHKICGNKPIWLTEFATLDGPGAATDNFVQTVIPKLDQIEYLEAYSYFMADNVLMSSSGLSSAGKLYASAA